MGWLSGRSAIITGGGSGLGRALVQRFCAEGARVGVLERDPAKADELRREFSDRRVVVVGDVTVYEDNDAVVQAVVKRFGKLDVFVANAGVFDFFSPLVNVDPATLSASFDELFAINVKGVLLGVKASLPHLVESRGSVIVTGLSSAAFQAGGGGALYTASKHALRGVVRQLAHELAPKVRVNGVAPGGMRTELSGLVASGTHQRKLGDASDFEQNIVGLTPQRIAPRPSDHCGSYVLLASQENSGAMTGEIIRTDGGLAARGLKRIAGGEDL